MKITRQACADFFDALFGNSRGVWKYHIGFTLAGLSFFLLEVIMIVALNEISESAQYWPPDSSIVFALLNLASFLILGLISYGFAGIVYSIYNLYYYIKGVKKNDA